MNIIATIAIKHKTFEQDKPGWIAALVDARKRKEKYTLWLETFKKTKHITSNNKEF